MFVESGNRGVLGKRTSFGAGEPGQPDEAFGLEGRDAVVGSLLGLADPGVIAGNIFR